jgi:lincosamide and streptogramin A transport system ATP-binding/permease protein
MSAIVLTDLDFHYQAPYKQIFERLSIAIDTSWRTALVGRNGRGKTTLLRLLSGALEPTRGSIALPAGVSYFPYEPADAGRSVLEVLRECIAPFDEWERRMEELLASQEPGALEEYGEMLERYERSRGYSIDGLIEREVADVGMPPAILEQRFETLSGGERTRALIAALFLKDDAYPLIDEPTNHLDMAGREIVAEYLSRKRGFLLVSHDRHVLDISVDHVLSINRSDVRLHHAGFAEWYEQMELEEEFERRREANLRREIEDLEETARNRRTWAGAKEKEKKGAPDKGFIGHRAAKVMKRALHAERRVEEMIEEKSGLLKNAEGARKLKLDVASHAPSLVAVAEDVSVVIDGATIIANISLEVRAGERIALVGPNGSGKTTLLRAMAGEIAIASGAVHIPKHLAVARAYQTPLWSRGFLREHLRDAKIEETRFRMVMAALGVTGEIFDRPLESFSQGERKKVDLCRSFVGAAHLWIWDEPMNYIDLVSREQIADAVAVYEAAMLFVEHDRWFVEQIATRVVEIGKDYPGRM